MNLRIIATHSSVVGATHDASGRRHDSDRRGRQSLNITGQGAVETTDAVIGSANLASSNSTVNVTGAGSLWTVTEELNVGFQGTGTLNITSGGTVRTLVDANVGLVPGSSG